MSADSDLIKLYSDRILALAADMSATTPLQDPHISVKKRSPLCGSVVTVDIKVKAGQRILAGDTVLASLASLSSPQR